MIYLLSTFSNNRMIYDYMYIMAWWSYSFVCTLHYLVVIIMQTHLMVLDILLSVCLTLSQLTFMQYMGLCVFSFSIYLTMIVRMHVFYRTIIIKSAEVWPICHCLGLGHETMVYVVNRSIFVWFRHTPTNSPHFPETLFVYIIEKHLIIWALSMLYITLCGNLFTMAIYAADACRLIYFQTPIFH